MEEKFDTLKEDIVTIKIGIAKLPLELMELAKREFMSKESGCALKDEVDKLRNLVVWLFGTSAFSLIGFLVNIVWTIVAKSI